MSDIKNISHAIMDAAKTKEVILDAATAATGFTVFGLTGAQWIAAGSALLIVLRLLMAVWDVADRLRVTRRKDMK